MRVVHVPRRFTRTHWGGTETVILQTCRQQKALGHDVSIATSMALASEAEETIDGVPVKRFPHVYPWFGLSAESRHRLDQKGGNLFSFELHRWLQQSPGIDLLHLHTAKRLGGIVRHAALRRRIPYIISVHGGLLDVPAAEAATFLEPTAGKVEWGKLLGWWVGSRRVFDDAAAILCLGQEEHRRVQQRYPNVRAVQFPNGVDAPRFSSGDGAAFRAAHGIPTDATVILVMGRIDGQKNQLLAIRALAALRQNHPNLHLVLIGHVTDDVYERKVRAAIESNSLNGAVTLIPGISAHSEDLQNAYHAADVFLLPSIHEPFGIVVLEAWAAGLPVVASRVGGIPTFVDDGKEGVLFESNNDVQVVKALENLLAHPELMRDLANAGREKALREFSWESITNRLMNLYEEVVRENPLRK